MSGRYDTDYLVQFWRERSQQLRQQLADREPVVITRVAGPAIYLFTEVRWSRLAHFADKKFHYGRAGTLRKIRHAYAVEADSLDSNFPLWTVARMGTFRQEQVALETQEQGVLI